LALDAAATTSAETVVQRVVVVLTVWVVVEDVEVAGSERGGAGLAHEAGFVVAAC